LIGEGHANLGRDWRASRRESSTGREEVHGGGGGDRGREKDKELMQRSPRPGRGKRRAQSSQRREAQEHRQECLCHRTQRRERQEPV
jgi:hypothetical protein